MNKYFFSLSLFFLLSIINNSSVFAAEEYVNFEYKEEMISEESSNYGSSDFLIFLNQIDARINDLYMAEIDIYNRDTFNTIAQFFKLEESIMNLKNKKAIYLNNTNLSKSEQLLIEEQVDELVHDIDKLRVYLDVDMRIKKEVLLKVEEAQENVQMSIEEIETLQKDFLPLLSSDERKQVQRILKFAVIAQKRVDIESNSLLNNYSSFTATELSEPWRIFTKLDRSQYRVERALNTLESLLIDQNTIHYPY